MPEENDRSLVGGLRDKFLRLTNRSKHQEVIDSTDEDEPPEEHPWESRLAALARGHDCRDGLIPEIEHRISILDGSMDLVSESLADLNKVLGARNALQSLLERLQQGE